MAMNSDMNNIVEEVKTAVDQVTTKFDERAMPRVMRFANHVPALMSLAYFGLIATQSMMPFVSTPFPKLAEALTEGVGRTTNAMFSSYFPTLVTPPSVIFWAWPLIAATQFVTLMISATVSKTPMLSQIDLSALSLANLVSAGWLTVASNSFRRALPLKSLLLLPLIPFISAYPLRRDRFNTQLRLDKAMFQLYSSFTTIAAFLALAVELQHGGRLPFFRGKAELSAIAFLLCYLGNVQFFRHGVIRRYVNAIAISGIFLRRFVKMPMVTLIATGYVTVKAWQQVRKSYGYSSSSSSVSRSMMSTDY